MTNQNPFNFIDPLLINFPANKSMICPDEKLEHHETYFNGNRSNAKQRWAYDNYFFRDIPFEIRQKRGDCTNIDDRMQAIHVEELKRPVPVCTQSWYGHRVASYNQITGEVYTKKYELRESYRSGGVPWPKMEREQAFTSNAVDILKPYK